MSLPTRWNLIKPEIGSAGAWCGIRGFDVVAHGGRVGALATGKPAIPCKPEWKPTAGNRANWLLFVVTDLVTTGQATQVRSSRIGGCEPACEPAQYARQNAYQRCVPGCIPQGNPLQDVRTLAILEKKPFHFAVLRTKEGARSGTPSRKTFSPPPRPHFFGLAFRPFLSVHSFGCRATKRRTSNLWRSGVSLLGRQPLGKHGAMVDHLTLISPLARPVTARLMLIASP